MESVLSAGVRITLVKGDQNHFDLCLTTPDGRTSHPVSVVGAGGSYGVYATPFADGTYLATDSLGHVFTQIYPGNISGVTVVLPDGNQTRLLGPFVGSVVVEDTTPFGINHTERECTPSCAEGRSTTRLLQWVARLGDYR